MNQTASVVGTALVGVLSIFAGPGVLIVLLLTHGALAALLGLVGVVWAAILWPYVKAEIATDWDNAKQQAHIAQVLGRSSR